MMRKILLATLVAGCTLTPSEVQNIMATVQVACFVDQAVVPIAQPIVAALGPAGTAVSAADLLVHPAVVAACQAIGGTPKSVTLVSVTTPPSPKPLTVKLK